MRGATNVLRMAASLLWTLVVVGCTAAPSTNAPSQAAAPASDPAVEFLLTAAAKDFQTHAPPQPVRFRNVRAGYLTAADGTRQYRLCGEFLPAAGGTRAEWTPFATIQTSGYEQWLGPQSIGFCHREKLTWDTEDLSASLQSHLDGLR